MAITKNAQEIEELLDRQLFEPIARTSPDSFPTHQREAATDIQDELSAIRQRIHTAGSAEEKVRLFGTLAAEQGQSLDARLKSLALPTVSEARYHVDKLAAELGLHWQDDEPGSGSRGTRQDA